MARVNVYLPDELLAVVREHHPGVNLSRALRSALEAIAGCRHDRMGCATCGADVDRRRLVDEALSALYRDVVAALEHPVAKGATAEGAARVIKRVAIEHAVSVAEAIPLPRPTQAERDENAWNRAQEEPAA